ncbi:MAG: hypothetical protein ACW98U_16390 [Candidatus Thorarchaeota archaeon]
MNQKDESEDEESRNYRLIGGVLFFVAVFSPLLMMLNSSYGYIEVYFATSFFAVIITPYSTEIVSMHLDGAIMSLFFMMTRFTAIYQIIKYYRGESSKKHAYLLALVSDSIILAITIIGSIISSMFYMTYIPTPIFLVVCVVLLWFYPLKQPRKPWAEDEEQRGWWEEEESEE